MAVVSGSGSSYRGNKVSAYKSPKQKAAEARAKKIAAEKAAAAAARRKPTTVKPLNLQPSGKAAPSYKSPSVGSKAPAPKRPVVQTGASPRTAPLITRAPTPSGFTGGTKNTGLIKPTTKMPSGQTAAQVAYAAKYRRAREMEKAAAAKRTGVSSGATIPRTGSAGAAVGAAKGTAPAKGPAKPSPAAIAFGEQKKRSEEIKRRQAQEAQLRAYMAKASTAVQAELLPALNELTRQIASLQARGKKATDETTQFGQRAESDLTELFGRLGNFTNQVQSTNNTAYEGLKSGTNAAYGQLQANLGQRFDGAQAAATAENERLGLSGTAQAPIQGMERDQQFLQGLASTDQAAMQAGLGQSQQGFNQLMGMASQTAAQTGASMVGQTRNQTQKSLADIMFEMNQGITDVEGQRGDIEATRGEKIRQLAEAMGDKDYNRNMEQQQMSFEQRLAQARFGLEKQQVEASLQPQAASYEDQLRIAKLEQELSYEAARQQKAANDAALMEAIRKSGFGPAFR